MRVSIVTAVYNGVDTLQDVFDSVASQSYAHIEHVVVDGASTDGTAEILKQNRHRISVLVSEPDGGIYDALNKGIELATGDVVGFLHADDVFEDEEVISQIARVFQDSAVQAVYGDLVYVNRSNPRKIIRRWRAGQYSRRRLRWGWMPPHPTFYVRRSVYQKIGAFDTSHQIAADYDCILRMLGKGEIVPAYLPRVLVRMRAGGASNRSVANMIRKSREDYLALRRNNVGGLFALIWKNVSKVKQFL